MKQTLRLMRCFLASLEEQAADLEAETATKPLAKALGEVKAERARIDEECRARMQARATDQAGDE